MTMSMNLLSKQRNYLQLKIFFSSKVLLYKCPTLYEKYTYHRHLLIRYQAKSESNSNPYPRHPRGIIPNPTKRRIPKSSFTTPANEGELISALGEEYLLGSLFNNHPGFRRQTKFQSYRVF